MAIHVQGIVLAIVGALIATFHGPLGLLQVKSRSRWLRLDGGAVKASRAVILLIGVATMVGGVLVLVDGSAGPPPPLRVGLVVRALPGQA